MCLNPYKLYESYLKFIKCERKFRFFLHLMHFLPKGSQILPPLVHYYLPSSKFQGNYSFRHKFSHFKCIKIVAYYFNSTCGNYSISHKFRHRMCEAYSSMDIQWNYNFCHKFEQHQCYVETYLPCHQSSSLNCIIEMNSYNGIEKPIESIELTFNHFNILFL